MTYAICHLKTKETEAYYLFIYLFRYSFIYLFIYLDIYLFIYLFIYLLFIYLFIYLFILVLQIISSILLCNKLLWIVINYCEIVYCTEMGLQIADQKVWIVE